MFNKNKSVFDKINDYLTKKGHNLVMSIYLSNYNGNNIYIRFDYVKKLAVYKIVWIDLNYFNEKHIEDYISTQLVTKFMSLKIVERMSEVNHESGYEFNDNIMGDRVEILTYFKNSPKEFIFDRFVPLEWEFLLDPMAMIFSYLPRSMEVFLNEMFAKFDGFEEKYNYLKPIKFNIHDSDPLALFKKKDIIAGIKLFEDCKVKFLERIEDNYLALVEDKVSYLVSFTKVDEEFIVIRCNCGVHASCKHLYAGLHAIRNNKFNNFYKVKYVGREESLLEKITLGSFNLSIGIENDKLLIITSDNIVCPVDIVQNGKVVFEVIEDDDECSLSKQLKEFKKK